MASATKTSKNGATPIDDLVTEASLESFPASDPPSYMGGATPIGEPASHAPQKKRERASKRGSAGARRR